MDVEHTFEIREEPIGALERQAAIPSAFEVRSILDVVGDAVAGFRLVECALRSPYIKDYDANAGERPSDWARRFDVHSWGLLGAYSENVRVGGAVIAFADPGVDLLEGRADLAVLWDIRVAPSYRERGMGAALFRATAAWARSRACGELKVETQNINVPACRFYQACGCTLVAANRGAYPQWPDEVQVIWRKRLANG